MIIAGHRAVTRFFTIVSALFFALTMTAASQSFEPDLPNPGNPSVSRQQQEQLGFQTATQVYQQMPVLPDSSPETQYIRQIGQRLAATIPQQYSWPFEFHVIAQKEINAFALPGGEMFVNLGAITAAASEAQLAGVMAHEMGHVYMQHSAKQMQKAQMMQGLEGLAGAILGNSGGMLGSLGQAGIQVGAGMAMLHYSRGDEAQADAVGAIILYRAGYNPQALADFFKTLEAQGGTGPQFLSDHPNPGNREESIQHEIRNWPPLNYRTDNAAFAHIRELAAHTKAYTADEISAGAKAGQWTTLNRRNGAILTPPAGVAPPAAQQAQPSSTGHSVPWSDVAPSSSFQLTDLGEIRLVRPANWAVVAPQQQGQFITIAPRAGMVSNGIGYGVLVNGMSAGGQQSLDQITASIVRSLQGDGSNLRQVGNITEISVAGVRGRSVNLQSISPFSDANGQPQGERDRVVTIPKPDGTVIYLVFVAPTVNLDRLNPTFDRILRSVQF